MPTIVAVLVGIVIVVAGVAAVFILGMRAKSPLVLRPLFWISKRFMNPVQLRTAGTPGAYAGIIRARGRVSGRMHATPVGIIPEDGGFLIALPYGSKAQWLHNVLAAGEADLVTEGRRYHVDQPELVPTADLIERFSAADQRLFRVFNTTECLRLRTVAELDEVPAATDLAA